VQTESRELNVLLISDSSERAGMLRHVMEQQGITCMMRRVDPGNGACAYVRRTGLYRKTVPADLVLVDFAAPDVEKTNLLREIGFGSNRSQAPVIVLTGDRGERLLGRGEFSDSTMFSPTELGCFLRKMGQHRQRRFVKALDVMYRLGPVLVRVPRSFVQMPVQTAVAANA